MHCTVKWKKLGKIEHFKKKQKEKIKIHTIFTFLRPLNIQLLCSAWKFWTDYSGHRRHRHQCIFQVSLESHHQNGKSSSLVMLFAPISRVFRSFAKEMKMLCWISPNVNEMMNFPGRECQQQQQPWNCRMENSVLEKPPWIPFPRRTARSSCVGSEDTCRTGDSENYDWKMNSWEEWKCRRNANWSVQATEGLSVKSYRGKACCAKCLNI